MTIQPTILLVEDQLMARIAAQALLTTLGCKVIVAENGMQALALAAENHLDLVFMDIGLPDKSGFEVTKDIRQLPAPYGAVPIIALTAHDDKELIQLAQEVGMQGFYTKPLTKELIHTILEKFCKTASDNQ
jgi:CheY-like chemotaxis protein